MSTNQPTSANHSYQSLAIGAMQLPTEKGDYANIRLTSAKLDRSTEKLEYHDAATGAVKVGVQISATAEFPVKLVLRSANPQTEHTLLRALEGDNIPSMFHPGNNSFTPSITEPLFGFSLLVSPWTQLGGDIGTAAQVEATHMVNGAYEVLSAPITPPAGIAAVNPASATIDITIPMVAGFLPCHANLLSIRGFNVYRSGTLGATPVDPYVKVNLTEVANTGAGVATFQDTGLTPVTPYYYVTTAVWYYGLESAFSAEVTETTTA